MIQAVVLLCIGLFDVSSQTERPTAPSQKPAIAAERTKTANPYAAALAGFKLRVDGYLALRNALTKKIPEVKETGDPAKISGREKALGQAIATARPSAKAADVFGDLAPHLRKILDEDWKSRSPADRQSLFAEIPAGLELNVNQPYPTTIPLITVPAKLLAQLPMLPEELEYRLVDRRLLLRDRDANVIVDVLESVPARREAAAPAKRN